MGRLTTDYLGLELRSPLVASPSPLTGKPEAALRMQEQGAAAIVLPSLFEEEAARADADLVLALEAGSEHFAEAITYFPALDSFETIPERYLGLVHEMKQRLQIPVIASLNASSQGGWVRFARLVEQAGADALELNLYRIAADPSHDGSAAEASDLEVVRSVKESLRIPLSVKLSPYYSALANFAARVIDAGASGLVLFNRFYQPDLDPDSRDVVWSVELSQSWELRLPLRWTAILRPCVGDRASLAVTSGVDSGLDVAKVLLTGANVAMMTSAILRRGPEHFARVERQLLEWMDRNEYESVSQFRGSVSYATTDNPAAFERAQYVRTLHSWTTPYGLTPNAPSA
jgi:dihydroorotate dehydrogenase (fumarate)